MGIDAGGAFYNMKENGDEYYNVVVDDVIKELCPILKELKITMRETPLKTRKENSPIFKFMIYKPKEKI